MHHRQPSPVFLTPRWRYLLVTALYAYQGLVAGFSLVALPNHLASLGATTAQIGAHLATVGLPWILQPAWGPLVDRFGGFRMGRRRFWIVAGLLATLGALARLLAAPEVTVATFASLSAIFLVHSVFATLIDTATDALIIDRVPAGRLGTTNALSRTGFVGGMALGTASFGWLLPNHGLTAVAAGLLAVGAVALALALLVREAPDDAWVSLRRRREDRQPVALAWWRGLRALIRDPATLGLVAFCFVLDFAGAAFRVPLAVELIQRQGWAAAELSAFQASAGLIAGTAGALVIGWWTDRAGPGRTLPVLLGSCALGHAGVGALLFQPAGTLAAAAAPLALGVATVLPALMFVALAPAVMLASGQAIAATRFALFMAALNMGDVAGSAAAGRLEGTLGPAVTGLAAGAVFAAGAAIAARRHRPDRSAH